MSTNNKKRQAITEDEVFQALKNFPENAKKRKSELQKQKTEEEQKRWIETLNYIKIKMLNALEAGNDYFSVYVDDLTETQRDELAKKINGFPNMQSTCNLKPMSDGEHHFVMEVKVLEK